MYEFALEVAARASVEELGEVSHISRRDFDERTTCTFLAQVPCLEYVSLLIETAVLLRTNRAGRVYTGFQKLSRMKAIADRYLRIADLSERLYVFGEADWKPPRHPNMRIVHTPSGSKLAREWIVVADSPSLRVALVAIEDDRAAVAELEQKHFRAIKTSDPALVERLADAAEQVIDNFLAA
ncbi:MAG TPA: DICT sensory domain-containing protein [Pyrinomonadaceae bacterium]|nr:DICT sensory domain-containing protein [Pyrinomonadaceae bacterium]